MKLHPMFISAIERGVRLPPRARLAKFEKALKIRKGTLSKLYVENFEEQLLKAG